MSSANVLYPAPEAVPEIVALAYEHLHEASTARYTDQLDSLEFALRKNKVGVMGVCVETSSAVTHAAQHLGYTATREVHPAHSITSFAPLDALPSDDDLIMCMTWGQFNPSRYNDTAQPYAQQPYFGLRRDIYALGVSRGAFAATTVSQRQAAHCRSPFLPIYLWLNTTPAEVTSGEYPLGLIDYSDYPPERWVT